MRRHDFIAERPALAAGQNPFAGILSCADSRVGPRIRVSIAVVAIFSFAG